MKTQIGLDRDEILVDEIGRLAPFFSRWSVKLAARSLRTDTKSTEVTLQLPPERALEVAARALKSLGRILSGADGGQLNRLKAVVGSGRLNLNPALIEIEIEGLEIGGAAARVTASAKEGLHYQNTAGKAIERVVALLIELP